MKSEKWLDQMQRRERLQQALVTQIDENTCQACMDQLDAYIVTQLGGGDYMEQFPKVAVHMDMCNDCAAAYARLYELALAEAANRLPRPVTLPRPNLAFLGQTVVDVTVPAAGRLIDQLREAVWQTGKVLTLQFSEALLVFLRPFPNTALARRHEDKQRYGELLFSMEPVDNVELNLPVTFSAYRDAQQPQVCLVELIYEPSGQSWPDLAGNQITITIGEEQNASLTDPWGLVSFSGIPVDALPQLKIEIRNEYSE